MDVLKSSEIEGELLDQQQVRSSIARRLGMEIAGMVPSDRNVEGVVEMMLDATQHYTSMLTVDRLFGWHAALFPTGHSGMNKIVVANWRQNLADDPMQVISGPIGHETIHFQAPSSEILDKEMVAFLRWFNEDQLTEPVLKAAIAHLWFVTLHPFEDGNGRIARALTDMQLARADHSAQRFYSMSLQITKERKAYYEILEKTQKGDLDITDWMGWFLECLNRALHATSEILSKVLQKAEFWQQHGKVPFNERQRLMLNKLMDGFEGVLNSSKWAKIAKCSQDTAARDISQLIGWNILRRSNSGGRSTNYLLDNQ
jgi:Fic family protein